MALSADKNPQYRDGIAQDYPVAADAVIYLSALVAINTSGYAVPAAASAGLVVVGFANEKVDNTGGANGAKTVVVRRGCDFKVKGSSLTQAKVGAPMYVVDDQTVGPAPAGTAVADEVLVADAGGATTIFEGFLANDDIVPGGVSIAATVGAAGVAMADDGKGKLSGTGGTGFIHYESGYYRLIFTTAPDDNTAINASYHHGRVMVPAGTLAKYESATSGWLRIA